MVSRLSNEQKEMLDSLFQGHYESIAVKWGYPQWMVEKWIDRGNRPAVSNLLIRGSLEKLVNAIIQADLTQRLSYASWLTEKLTTSKEGKTLLRILKPEVHVPEEETPDIKKEVECRQCYENEYNAVLIPCGHLGLCFECAKLSKGKDCPFCRTHVREIIKTFLV